ncbi:MAG TPA: MFS transporter, partial [Chitinophagaceae bacterium]|nr:MFS transporter [Chitinophagaceae bacterium]
WIFFVNLPIGAIAALLSWLFVTNLEGNVKPRKIDWWGIAFLAVAASTLQYVLEEGGSKDWFDSTPITILFIIALTGTIAFIWRELSIDYPAVNIRLLKNYNLAIGNILMIVVGATLMSSMFIFPLFVRNSLGWTSIQTGVCLMYLGLACSVGIIVARKILDKGMNQKVVMIIGLLLIAAYLVLMSFSSLHSHESNFVLPLLIGGVGMGFFMLPVLSLSLAGLRGKDLAQGTGLNNMLKRLGGAIGLAVMNIYLNHENAHVGNAMVGYINGYNPITTERLAAFRQLFINAGYATDQAIQAAWQMMGNVMQQQQLLVSYNNGYLMVGLVILCCIPVILFIRTPKKQIPEPSPT